MKTLIVYYSRTGYTEKVARKISRMLECDIEEIDDMVDRKGFVGYLKAGYHTVKKHEPKLKSMKFKLSEYDNVILGFPIWAGSVPPAIRSYLKNNNLKNGSYFCTAGGGKAPKINQELKDLNLIKPKSTLILKTVDVKKDNIDEKLKKFVKNI